VARCARLTDAGPRASVLASTLEMRRFAPHRRARFGETPYSGGERRLFEGCRSGVTDQMEDRARPRSGDASTRPSATSIGGSDASWRSRATMLVAPVLARMLPIWVRTVAIDTAWRRATSCG